MANLSTSNNKLTNLSESPEPQTVPNDVAMTGEVPDSEAAAPSSWNDSMDVWTLLSNSHMHASVGRLFLIYGSLFCFQIKYNLPLTRIKKLEKVKVKDTFLTVPDWLCRWSLWNVSTKTLQGNICNKWLPVQQTQHRLYYSIKEAHAKMQHKTEMHTITFKMLIDIHT